MDRDRIDEATLALLYLGLHDGMRAWKSFDWDVTDRLHEKGLIDDPRNKAKSLVFTEEGLNAAQAAFERNYGDTCNNPQIRSAEFRRHVQ